MFENLSMYEAVKLTAEKYPNNLAVYYQGKKISYRNFIKRVDRMADILFHRLGVRQNDVVLVAQPNIPDTLVLAYAINKIGAVTNFVHPYTPFNQIHNIMIKTHTKVAFLFEQRVAKEVKSYRRISDKIYVTRVEDDLPMFKKGFYHTFMDGAIRKKLGKYRGQFAGFNYVSKLKPTGLPVETVKGKEKDVSVLLHSGSTTGDPKTICLSDSNFNYVVEHADEFLCTSHDKIKAKGMLSVLPSFHGFGFCMTMHQPLTIGFSVVLIPKYSAKEVVNAMKHTPISLICGVPTMYDNLVHSEEFNKCKQIKNLYVSWCGGDYLPPSTKEAFDKLMEKYGAKCRLFEGYGLTEAISVNTINTFDNNRLGSIGKAMSGTTVKIVDDNGNELPKGEVGEICLKGGATMVKYLDNEEGTKQALRDGWVYTGDLGYLDEDNFLYYKSRLKRVIKVSGVGVFPSEIENLVCHIPGIKAVCAIEIPDVKLQHGVKLFVIADYFDEEGMRNQIMDTCKKYLIRWAMPREIEFVKELPKTLIGKIDYKKVQAEENARREGKI